MYPKAVLEGLYSKGKTMHEVARELGVGVGSVHRWITKYGIRPRTSADYARLRLNLSPSREIAYILGILKGDGSVFSFMQKNGRMRYVVALTTIDKEFAESYKTAVEREIKPQIKLLILGDRSAIGFDSEANS